MREHVVWEGRMFCAFFVCAGSNSPQDSVHTILLFGYNQID